MIQIGMVWSSSPSMPKQGADSAGSSDPVAAAFFALIPVVTMRCLINQQILEAVAARRGDA